MKGRLLTAALAKSWIALALLALLAGGFAPAAMAASADAAGVPIPPIIVDPPLPWPYWVSASAVDRALAEKLLHPAVEREIREILGEREVNGCVHLGKVWEDILDPQPRDTIEHAAASADLVFTARVVGTAQGFRANVAGTLLAVRPTEWLKGDQRGSLYFVFFPLGDFTVGSKRICKTDDRYAALPPLGDEILVFSERSFNPANQIIHDKDPGDLVTLHGDQVLLPRQYRADRPAPLTPEEAPGAIRPEPNTRQELMALIAGALKGGKP